MGKPWSNSQLHLSYTKYIGEHYGVSEADIKAEILHTEICGEKTKNCDGTVQFIFSNINNVQTYPAVPMLLDGEKVGTFFGGARTDQRHRHEAALPGHRVRGHGQ